uniref:Uncharacterized protein n=1 Tax=Romanomermis culicivorax TaxID=13658 RepID=A0A915JET6_ROMCU
MQVKSTGRWYIISRRKYTKEEYVIFFRPKLILDYNKKIYDHVPGPCQKIDGIRFSVTDVELLPDGHAIISSGYHKTLIADAKKKRKGRLYAYDFSSVQNLNKTLKQAAVEIKLIFDATTTASNFNGQGRFNPVALSSFVSKNVINLYVINSIADYDSVECFIYDKNAKTATHMKTIKDGNIYSAYDIQAYGPDKFFLTNQFYFRSRFLNLVETYLLFNLGNLIHFDGKKSTIVDSRLTTPRGLAIDKNET